MKAADLNASLNFDLLGQFKQSLVQDKAGIVKIAEDYCGKNLYPRQRVILKLIFLEELDGYEEDVLTKWIKSTENHGEVEICPMIRERVDYLRDKGYPHFTNIQLIGGRRSGKGFMTAAAMTKKIYDLVQMDEPARQLGMDPDKDFYFSIVADSEVQAKTLQFKDVVEFLLSCKPLVDGGYVDERRVLAETVSVYTPYDLRKLAALRSKGVKPNRDMAGIKVRAFAKNARTVRGTASICLTLDEFAHFMQGTSVVSDAEVLTAAKYALQQFDKNRMLFANSSPYTELGEFYAIYKESKELESDFPKYPENFMLRWPSWESYTDWETEPAKFTMAQMVPPWQSEEMAQEEKKDPEKFSVEVRSNFAKVIDAYLNPTMVDRMYDPRYTAECLNKTIKTNYVASGLYQYKGHSDPSTTTANFGIAIGHLEEARGPDGDTEMHVVFDLIDAWYPEDTENHVIDWMNIIPQITNLLDQFRPTEFTFDQFNSAYAIQQLNDAIAKKRINSVRVYQKDANAKLNMTRAENFKAALNLGRIHAPYPEGDINERSLALSREELKHLQMRNGRVDKQSIGAVQTKDIADCIMEVTDFLIAQHLNPLYDKLGSEMAIGAKGGYSIGGRMTPTDPYQALHDFYDRPKESPNRMWGRIGPRRRRR